MYFYVGLDQPVGKTPSACVYIFQAEISLNHVTMKLDTQARLDHIDNFQKSYKQRYFKLPEDIEEKEQIKEDMKDAKVWIDKQGKTRWICPRNCGHCYACNKIKLSTEKAVRENRRKIDYISHLLREVLDLTDTSTSNDNTARLSRNSPRMNNETGSDRVTEVRQQSASKR